MSGLQQVNADIASLQHLIATGTLAEKAEARQELAEIFAPTSCQPPGRPWATAQAALASCRQAGGAGTGECSGVTRTGTGQRAGATV